MSTFIKIGNTILNNSRKNKNIDFSRSKSVFSETFKPNYLKKSSSVSSFPKYNIKYQNNNSINTPQKISQIKGNTTNFNFYNSNQNNYKKFSDLRNTVQFHSFNKKDYILEANKIIQKRTENKNTDLLGLKNKTKTSIISDTKEICLNNFVIEAIKNNINNMNIKEKDHKQSLVISENEFETDYKTFLNFLENRKNKLKKENDNLLKCKEIHEEAKERYYKELAKYKKLNEDLEKKIKIISLLKNYANFVYKLLGMNFWMEEIPDLDQKNKNFEEISDLILKKYDYLEDKKDIFSDQQDNFDDTFMIIIFNDFGEKVIQGIKFKENVFKELDKEINYEEYLIKLTKNVNILKAREKKLVTEKNKLTRNIDNSKNKKQKDENVDQFLEYIIELGKETEKYDINEYNFFENNVPKEYQKMVKEYDFNYYTVKTMENLKKKERLINNFIEYIENIENSEDKKIIAEIEQDRKNENKRQKLKDLKLKQQQIHENRNKKAMERNAKFVVIGRIVPKIYQFNKSKNLKSNKDTQNENDMDLLFFNDEDEK